MTGATHTAAYVYCLAHRTQARFKVGKANNVLERARVLGLNEFSLHRSFAVLLPDPHRAFEVEKSLQRLASPWRIAPEDLEQEGELPAQGFTEWFHIRALPQVRALLQLPLIGGSIIEGDELARQLETSSRTPRHEQLLLARARDPRTESERRMASFLAELSESRKEWPKVIDDCRTTMSELRARAARMAFGDGSLFIAGTPDSFEALKALSRQLSVQAGRLVLRCRTRRFPTISFASWSRPIFNAKHHWLRQHIGVMRPILEVGSSLQSLFDFDLEMDKLLWPAVRELADRWAAPLSFPIEGWDADLSEETDQWLSHVESHWQDQQ